jgi:hypothetical protein
MARRESKPQIDVPKKASFAPDNGDAATGWIVRLSISGLEVESLNPPAVGADVVVRARLLEDQEEMTMRGRVQWASATRFGVQFAPMGARDTHAILRATRCSAA